MKKNYRSFIKLASVLLLLVVFLDVNAQEREISGTVTDSGGIGMPGVNVVKKGTSRGTATDATGKFVIVADADDVLSFSFIGYKAADVAVGAQTIINVTLQEDVETLEEVVVVGYGEMKRSDLSTAQVSVGQKQISKTINTTIDQAIQGRAAGVYVTQNSGQPGGGVSVMIRGISTLNGTTEPLYVIDGVQMQPGRLGTGTSTNPLAGLNPRDVEDMQILQGPAATAIYGSRATNGVIVITTKRGKSGETLLSYGYQYSVQDRPEELDVMNFRQYAQMYSEIQEINGGTVPVEYLDPSLLPDGTNWQHELFKRAPLQQHNLSVSGGSDKVRYYLSGEFFDQDGVALGSGFKRYSTRLNVDADVKKWFKLGVNLGFNQTKEKLSNTSRGLILDALSLSPGIPVRDINGNFAGPDPTNTVNESSIRFAPVNPVAIASVVKNDLIRRGLLAGINGDLTILKGLVFKNAINGNVGMFRQDNFVPTYQFGSSIGYGYNGVATLSTTSGLSTYWNINQILQYSKEFAKHNGTIMVGHEAQGWDWKNVGGNGRGFVTNELPDIGLADNTGSTGGQGEGAMESFFTRLNYSYNDRYILQASLRRDGSVNFGGNNRWGAFYSLSAAWRISEEHFMDAIDAINELKLRVETGTTGNQGGASYFGLLQARNTQWGNGYRVSRYSNPNLAWEETNTNNIGLNIGLLENKFQIEADFYDRNVNNLLLTAPLPGYMGASNAAGGIQAPTVNIGEMNTRGWAVSVQATPYNRGGIKWETAFNASSFRSKITKLYTQSAFIERTPWFVGDLGSGNNWTQRATVGEAPWVFRGYVYDGLFQSVDELRNSALPVDNNGNEYEPSPNTIWVGDIKYKDVNGDGKITEEDKTTIGNPYPKLNVGFTNTISWKGFDLSVLIIGVFGNDVYNYLRFNNTNPNNISLGRNLMGETFNYARIEGDGDDAHLLNPGTDVPRISGTTVNGNGLRITDKFVEDGSYVRIKNVTLSYAIPNAMIDKQKIVRSVRLQVGVQNLATFTNYTGYDPEVGAYVGKDASEDNQALGLDYGRYPITPVYTFGVNVDF
jgi:TonB-dependent starch-binding outer membrane protein SusC